VEDGPALPVLQGLFRQGKVSGGVMNSGSGTGIYNRPPPTRTRRF